MRRSLPEVRRSVVRRPASGQRLAAWVRRLGLALAVTSGPATAWAGPYPDRVVTLVVGYAPGSSNDLVARVMAEHLRARWGQPVVVENRVGASAVIAANYVAKSPPDGYRLLVTSATHVVLPAMKKDLPFDAIADFTPVAKVGRGDLVLEVPPSHPATSVADLAERGRKDPLKVAINGQGTTTHLAAELFRKSAGLTMILPSYRGSPQAQIDLVAGRVDAVFQVTPSALPAVTSGQARALAVTGPIRLRELPDVPTMAEAGYPDCQISYWIGVYGPAGLPAEIAATVSAGLKDALEQPKIRDQFAAIGLEPEFGSGDDFAATIARDTARFGAVVRDAGIELN